MENAIVRMWSGHAGPQHPVALEVEFRRDGTYRATALQAMGAETTEGRYTVVAEADGAAAVVFEWTSAGGDAPLTERVTVTHQGDQVVLGGEGDEIRLTKRAGDVTDR